MKNKIILIGLISCFAVQCNSQNNFDELENFKNKITYLTTEKFGENYFDFKFDKLTFLDIKSNEEFTIKNEDLYIKLFSIIDKENCLLLRNSPGESFKSLKIKGLGTYTYLYKYNINDKIFNNVFKDLFDNIDKSPSIKYFEYVNNFIYFSIGNTVFKYDNYLKKIEKFFKLPNTHSIDKFSINPQKDIIAIQFTIMINDNYENCFGVYDILKQSSLFEMKFKLGGADLGNWSPNGRYLCFVDDSLYIYDIIENDMNTIQLIDSKLNGLEAKESRYFTNEEMILICYYKENGKKFTDIFKLNLNNREISRISNSKKYKYNLNIDGL